MSFLTGKPATSTSESKNLAYPYLQGAFGGQVATGGQANNALAALLGLGGDTAGATQGYQNFLNTSGFNNVLNRSSQGISGSAASRGLLNSGSTARALQGNASQLGQNYFSNYLQMLGGLNSSGLNAGQLIGGAGNYSTGTQTGATQGLGATLQQLGSAASGFAMLSDRRTKEDIIKLGEFEDGLGVYRFKYKFALQYHTGVMADEVAKLRPWALGPEVHGFATVNYEAL